VTAPRPWWAPLCSRLVRLGLGWRREPVSRDWGLERGLPVDRHYIETFLGEHRDDIRGQVLEFDADAYARRFGGDRVQQCAVWNLEPDRPGTTIVADLTAAGHIPGGQFDCIICTQVLELVYDLRAALYHLQRLLKPGGVLLVTVPGIGKLDPDWNDCWRFTPHSAGRLFREQFSPDNVAVRGYGNVLAATAFLHGLAAGELTAAEKSHADPEYALLIAVRAVKTPAPVQ
jgi:SAM-dependent methyltransferase